MSETESPSASAFVAVAVRVSFVFGLAAESATLAVGAVSTTAWLSVAAAPSTVLSFGVTVTETVWPRSPQPACERSSVSVSDPEPLVVFTGVPSTFQT